MVQVRTGLFSYDLGASVPISPELFTQNSALYLGITVAGDAEITPRTRLTSSGYAQMALAADTAAYAEQSRIADTAMFAAHALLADTAAYATALADNSVSSSQIVDASIALADLGQNDAAVGEVMKWDGAAWVPADDDNSVHTGAIYRWNTFDTYHNHSSYGGWLMNNDASMYGGITPSNWTDGSATASQMSSNPEILRTLLTRKGYGGKNATVVSDVFLQYSSTTGRITVVLFRVRNTTDGAIPWTIQFYYSCYGGWNENASVSLNGASSWSSAGATSSYNSNTSVTLMIPANQTSTIIVVTATGPGNLPAANDLRVRDHKLGFFNNSLELPAGLLYVDDLDVLQ